MINRDCDLKAGLRSGPDRMLVLWLKGRVIKARPCNIQSLAALISSMSVRSPVVRATNIHSIDSLELFCSRVLRADLAISASRATAGRKRWATKQSVPAADPTLQSRLVWAAYTRKRRRSDRSLCSSAWRPTPWAPSDCMTTTLRSPCWPRVRPIQCPNWARSARQVMLWTTK